MKCRERSWDSGAIFQARGLLIHLQICLEHLLCVRPCGGLWVQQWRRQAWCSGDVLGLTGGHGGKQWGQDRSGRQDVAPEEGTDRMEEKKAAQSGVRVGVGATGAGEEFGLGQGTLGPLPFQPHLA